MKNSKSFSGVLGGVMKTAGLFVSGAGLMFVPSLAGAYTLGQEPTGPGPGPFGDYRQLTGFVVGTVLEIIVWAFWVLAAIMVIYAAFVYLTAQGDGEKVSKASHMLLYAVIAMGVALLAGILPGFVASIIGG